VHCLERIVSISPSNELGSKVDSCVAERKGEETVAHLEELVSRPAADHNNNWGSKWAAIAF